MEEDARSTRKRWLSVRLATRKDAHWVHKLVGELANHQRLTAAFVSTEKQLEETLFNLPPYQGPTTFLLESSRVPDAAASGIPHRSLNADEGETRWSDEAGTSPIVHTQEIALRHEIHDTATDTYKCSDGAVVAGFVLFFPNYSTLVAKAGYYVEDLYIRTPYRGHGFGTVLLHTVALQALRRGAERLEWCVLDCDEEAIRFYKGLGAAVLPDWRICRLSGVALARCRHSLQSHELKPSRTENPKPSKPQLSKPANPTPLLLQTCEPSFSETANLRPATSNPLQLQNPDLKPSTPMTLVAP